MAQVARLRRGAAACGGSGGRWGSDHQRSRPRQPAGHHACCGELPGDYPVCLAWCQGHRAALAEDVLLQQAPQIACTKDILPPEQSETNVFPGRWHCSWRPLRSASCQLCGVRTSRLLPAACWRWTVTPPWPEAALFCMHTRMQRVYMVMQLLLRVLLALSSLSDKSVCLQGTPRTRQLFAWPNCCMKRLRLLRACSFPGHMS